MASGGRARASGRQKRRFLLPTIVAILLVAIAAATFLPEIWEEARADHDDLRSDLHAPGVMRNATESPPSPSSHPSSKSAAGPRTDANQDATRHHVRTRTNLSAA